MTVLWMVWAVALAGLLGGAAALAEWLLRIRGAPGRAPWALAIAASLALPAWAVWGPDMAAPSVSGPTPEPASLALLAGLEGVWDGRVVLPLAFLDPWLEVAWLLGSIALLAWLAWGLGRLMARARCWPRRTLSGEEVLVSEAFGPALLGAFRPRIVLPGWALDLDPERLDMVIRHEREHARAGDGALLLAAALAVVAAPWNPALWWQLRRLRGALEMDCDARVLQAGVPPTGYGRLLLALGARPGPGLLSVAGLARHDSLLERRLTMMIRGVDRGTRTRRTAAVIGALALVIVACEAPAPTSAPEGPAAESTLVQRSDDGVVLPGYTGDKLGSDPLLLVDGERVRGPLELVRERIARVEVLKGESARDVYGEDAADGVVVVTTVDGRGPAPPEAGEQPVTGVVTASEERPEAGTAPSGPGIPAEIPQGTEIFVDGEPFAGAVEEIDPDRIERVDIRKRADGTARIDVLMKR